MLFALASALMTFIFVFCITLFATEGTTADQLAAAGLFSVISFFIALLAFKMRLTEVSPRKSCDHRSCEDHQSYEEVFGDHGAHCNCAGCTDLYGD